MRWHKLPCHPWKEHSAPQAVDNWLLLVWFEERDYFFVTYLPTNSLMRVLLGTNKNWSFSGDVPSVMLFVRPSVMRKAPIHILYSLRCLFCSIWVLRASFRWFPAFKHWDFKMAKASNIDCLSLPLVRVFCIFRRASMLSICSVWDSSSDDSDIKNAIGREVEMATETSGL